MIAEKASDLIRGRTPSRDAQAQRGVPSARETTVV
jgi:hypothetical protein